MRVTILDFEGDLEIIQDFIGILPEDYISVATRLLEERTEAKSDDLLTIEVEDDNQQMKYFWVFSPLDNYLVKNKNLDFMGAQYYIDREVHPAELMMDWRTSGRTDVDFESWINREASKAVRYA